MSTPAALRPTSTPRQPLRAGWACAGVFGVVLAAYLPVLRAGFIWNDADYVTRADLQPLSGLGSIWFRVGSTEQYYPVLHSAFWLEHRLWGDAPLGYHLLNVLLHALAACLVALVLRALWRDSKTIAPGAEWVAALLFALHPVCVETVAWVSEQKNTLSTVFYLLAALAFLKSGPNLLATLCFALAAFSKSVTATLPAALLVVAWWRNGRISWKADVVPLLPWFAIGASAGLITSHVEHGYAMGVRGTAFALGFPSRVLVAGRAVAFYLGKLLWPHPLVFFYPRWALDPASVLQWLSPASVLGVLAWLWSLRGRSRGPLAVGLLFVGTLFPVLGFLDVYAFRFSFVADHFQYLAAIAPLAALAAVLTLRVGRLPRVGLVAVLLAVLGATTFATCGRYSDLETFYRGILARNPDAWIAHNNLGNFLISKNRVVEAAAEFQAALRTKPDYLEAEVNLGSALYRQGRIAEAAAQFRSAIALDPRSVEAHANLGEALMAEGRAGEAADALAEALRLAPANLPALSGLAQCLDALGRGPEAGPYYERALAAGARHPMIYNNLGGLMMAAGQLDKAAEDFRQAIRLDPSLAPARENLGIILAAQGKFGDAADQFREVVRLEPGNADARRELSDAEARVR